MAVTATPTAWLHAELRLPPSGNPDGPAAERLLAALVARQAAVVHPTQGGVLEAEFSGPIPAVECARRMQQAVARFNEPYDPAGRLSLGIGVDAGQAAAAEEGARRIGQRAHDGDILVSPQARNYLDPYLWGLCSLPTRGDDASHVEWNPTLPTRSQAEKQEAVFLDILLEETSIQISLNEGDEISGTLTYYEELPLEQARLEHVVAGIEQNFRLANALAGGTGETLANLRQLGTELYDLLFNSELKQHLARLTAQYLILNLNERAVAVPWELLYDGRDFLCRRFAMGRVVRTGQRPIGKPRPAPLCACLLVLSNPRGDLASATEEGLVIRNEFVHSPRVDVHMLNGSVNRQEAVDVLREHDILHYCGHARFVADKPGETGWLLSDGMISVADITERLAGGEKHFPSLVFSNACQSGTTGPWERERMADSMAQAFLLAGVQHYVGTFWDVLDAPSGDMAVVFYRRLASGQSIGKSLLAARERLAADRGEQHLIWAAYVLYGDPRRIFFGAPEAAPDRMLYGSAAAEPALSAAADGSSMATRSLPAHSPRATVPGWLLAACLLALIVVGVPFGLWMGDAFNLRTSAPAPTAGPAAAGAPADLSAGLELYRLGHYDEALAVFNRQAAQRPADPVLAGLARAARNRSRAVAEKERRERVDALVADLSRMLAAAPPPAPATPDEWTSPLLTTALGPLESLPDGLPEGVDVALMQWLEEDLLAQPRLSVLERRHLDALLAEIRLGRVGAADPDEAERLARLKLVRLWLFPALHASGNKLMLTLSASWSDGRKLFMLRQELGTNPEETAAAATRQLADKLRQEMPIRGRLVEQAPSAAADWWCNVGRDHGVSASTLFRVEGLPDVKLRVEQVEASRSLLVPSAPTTALQAGARIEQTD